MVLAGGRSSRMGAPKQALMRNGVSLARVAVGALQAYGCDRVVVVAPERCLPADLEGLPGVLTTLEDPPDGGPVAGLVAGLEVLGESDEVLVLACDLPHADELVAALVAEPLVGCDALVPIDGEGWSQWLAARYRTASLAAALARLGDARDVSVRRAMAPLEVRQLTIETRLLRDVDTPEQARAAGLTSPEELP